MLQTVILIKQSHNCITLVNVCDLWRENFLVEPTKRGPLVLFALDSWELQLQNHMQVLHQH